MAIQKATVIPLVAHWATLVDNDLWTADQQDAIAEQLVGLSNVLSPRIVMDSNPTDETIQAYLLFRIVDELESWLIRVSASYKGILDTNFDQYDPINSEPKLGLRSASLEEIEELPDIGENLALDIGKFVNRRPFLSDIGELIEIDGIGPDRLEKLRQTAYLDRPVAILISPSLSQFLRLPQMDTFLTLLNNSDLTFFFGDRNVMLRHSEEGTMTTFERVTAMIHTIFEQALRKNTPVNGVSASAIANWERRRATEGQIRNRLAVGSGNILINSDYVPFVKQQIEQAATSVNLMVFLGTTTDGDELHPAPLELVTAMEEAAGRGVDVRVILDQDDGGEPYKSFFINKKLVERFQAGQVQVKFDKKDTLLHSKVLIIDQVKAVVGSHNWTFNSFNNTHELSVFIDQEETANSYNKRFLDLWNALPVL